MLGAGGQKRVPEAFIENWRAALPPLETQKRIAAFLDQKTAQIDALIAKKQALLERLAEKRQALITQAVTKGLNPAAPMKNSGIDWLGQIPAHWEVRRLKFVTSKIGSGVTPRGGASVYVDEGVMLLRSQNVHFDGLELSDVAFIEPEIDLGMSETRVSPFDVLLNITGASIGRCCVYDRSDLRANVNQHVCIIRPTSDISPEFLSAFLSSPMGQIQIDLSQNGASREGLNFADLGSFLISLPNWQEQTEITAQMSEQVSRLKMQTSKVNMSIAGLQEYRSALITSAVTGQIEGLR
jgi:type I restriction enzyme S subunit